MTTRALPLTEPEFTDLLHALRRRHYKWDIYADGEPDVASDVIVLSPCEHELLVDSAVRAWRAITSLEASILADDRLLAAAGLPEALQTHLVGHEAAVRIARFDFHYSEEHRWELVECNTDVPGGLVEMAGLAGELSGSPGTWAERFTDVHIPDALETALCEALSPYHRIGLVYDTAFSIDLQQVELVADWLEERGHTVEIGAPGNIVESNGEFRLFDLPLDAVYRFFPGELIPQLPNAETWYALDRVLPSMNPLSAAVGQSKRTCAFPQAFPKVVAEWAADTLRTSMPYTVFPESLERARIIDERERWVIKTTFGRMGDGVAFGVDFSPEEWADAVDHILDAPESFVLQERFDTAPLWFSAGVAYPTIGVMLVNGEFAGYYSRYDYDQIISDGAKYVPTMVAVS